MIRGEVVGSNKVVFNIRAMYPRIRAELVRSTTYLSIMLSRYVKESKLSGQVLKNVTGTLRRSIHYKVTQDDDSVSGIVGTNKDYAAVHEYGFHGPVQVKEYVRAGAAVRAHTRMMNMPERSFLRSSLAEKKREIYEEWKKCPGRVIKNG